MEEFRRLTRLPAYVFNITSELKAAARRRGEDIIDFGMGNPDQPTPPHIVTAMRDAVERPVTHRYSASKGIPGLRKAICDWYGRRFDVDLDPETEAIATIGSKEGIAHLALAIVDSGDNAGHFAGDGGGVDRRHGSNGVDVDADVARARSGGLDGDDGGLIERAAVGSGLGFVNEEQNHDEYEQCDE